MILVTGASGGLGRLVVDRLASGHRAQVVAGTRTPDQLAPELPAGVTARQIDFDDPASLAEGFTGVDTVLLISAGYAENDVVIARHGGAIKAAERAGVRHLIYTSLAGAGDQLGYALPHRWTERRAQQAGMAWTVLRNGLYAELLVPDTGRAAATGELTAPLGDGSLAAVARQDLADVAARVLVEADAAAPSRHAGQVYELAGETAVGGADLAGVAAGIAGAPVAYRPGTLAGLRGVLAGTGLPGWQVENTVSTYSVIAAGFLAGTGGALRDLLAADPRPVLPLIAAAGRSSIG